MTSTALHDLSAAGVSIWLDDLSRSRLDDGSLARLLDTHHIVGVTTNPSIFDAAISNGAAYRQQIDELVAAGTDVDGVVRALTTDDVRRAADVLSTVYADTDGVDGQVSIEVDPRLADDAEGTVAQAIELWRSIDRPNVMIKIPATDAGLRAIPRVVAEGISVNVTLIFGLPRYREVINAWLTGLELARDAGRDIRPIQSVASFFVSRVDVEVNRRLERLGFGPTDGLHNTAALANARAAYQVFLDSLDTERWRTLAAVGVRPQRPLWASTGVKDPALPDTAYVTGLVAADTVNTVPQATLDAVFDHGVVNAGRIPQQIDAAKDTLDRIQAVGVSLTEVSETLEAEGVQKFVDAWQHLLATVETELKERR
ncbi:transaldolase [Pseudoclavibacter soli]|uniref:transaldolase n=1 Tax=Pseudoclavibacter soli TaxID=452623 RepID=UPI0003FDBF84|nr:transaldolase [Pseudoclavibacter soli]